MKKSKIIIAVVAVIVVAAIAAVAVPLLMEEKVPEGMVKVWLVESVETKNGVGYTYEYDEQGNLTAEIKSNSYKFSYDKDGTCIQEAYFTFIDNIQQQNDYIYDNDGNIIQKTYTFDDGRKWEFEYVYDENGLRIKGTSTQPGIGGTTLYEYNSDGKLILSYKEDDAEDKTEYTYDEDGRVVNEKQYSSAYGEDYNEYPYYEKINKYDENGRKLSMKENGTVLTEFVYNKEGKLIKIKRDGKDLDDIKCKSTYVIVTPEQAEKIKAKQTEIINDLA